MMLKEEGTAKWNPAGLARRLRAKRKTISKTHLMMVVIASLIAVVTANNLAKYEATMLSFPGLSWLFQRKNAGGYDPPPWNFEGRAIYQLHPVEVKTAKKYIPENLNIVQFGGYTLGGFYLANYTDSPARGTKDFGELVVVAGLVWNPPTSCAWASHVFVGSKSAKVHGEREVGLPEHMAEFKVSSPGYDGGWKFWKTRRPQVTVQSGGAEMLSVRVPGERKGWRAGFPISMRLPSFSGYNRFEKNLLTYSLDLKSRLSLVQPSCKVDISEKSPLHELLHRRPLISLCFEKLKMSVDPPSKHDPKLTFQNVPFKFLQKNSQEDKIEESAPKKSFLSLFQR